MENKTYHQQKNIEYTKKLREFLAVLPPYLTTYFRGIEAKNSIRTRLAYAGDLKTFFEWLQTNNPMYRNKSIREIPITALDELQAFDIEEYMEYLKLHSNEGRVSVNSASADFGKVTDAPENNLEIANTESTIKRKMAALRSMYAYFYRNQSITSNPTVKVDMPKLHEKAITRLDTDEIVKFLDTVENGEENMSARRKKHHEHNKVRDVALMTILLGTGVRVTECVGLDIKDIDLKNDRMKVVRKGGYESYVYFGEEVRSALIPYLEERELMTEIQPGHEDALFLSSRKRRISVRNVEIMVKNYARYVTTVKKITPHKLRSTYGTALYRETGDIYLVADVLGHKDVNTTRKHYAELEEERRRSAKDAVKLRGDEE